MRSLARQTFLTLVILTSGIANAGIVDSVLRPTVEEFKAAHNPWPAANPYPRSEYNLVHNGAAGNLMSDTKKSLASVIAQFEKAYPGERYVGLGRDSQFMVDAMDAFYTSIGQPGRVIRLNASGNSFQGADAKTIAAFLKSSGLDLGQLHRNPNSPGYIMFDGTHFNDASQSRQLIGAIYAEAAEMGMDLSTLVRKVNFISTSYNGHAYYRKNWIQNTDTKKFLSNMAAKISAAGPTEILATDAWYITHGHEWHSTFLQFQRDGRGRVFAPPGAINGIGTRKAVLADMYEIIQFVERPQFLESVKQACRDLGFEFKAKNARIADADPRAEREEQQRLQQQKEAEGRENARVTKQKLAAEYRLLLKLPAVDNPKYTENGDLKLTKAGWEIHSWYERALGIDPEAPSKIILLSLKSRDTKAIGDRDARRLIRLALNSQISPAQLEEIKEHLTFERNHAIYIEDKVLNTDEGVPRQVQKNGQAILPENDKACNRAVKGA